jgi:hypothetical protein
LFPVNRKLVSLLMVERLWKKSVCSWLCLSDLRGLLLTKNKNDFLVDFNKKDFVLFCLNWKAPKVGSIFEFDNWVLTWNPP